ALIADIGRTLGGMDASPTETTIWKALALRHSPEWASAHADLRAAHNRLTELLKPENRPLGALGEALEGDEGLAAARDLHNEHFARLVIISEQLRASGKLDKALETALSQREAIARAAEFSQNIDSMTQRKQAAPEPPSRPAPLKTAFALYARKLLKTPLARLRPAAAQGKA